MTKNHIEFVLSGYGVPYTDALADKLLEMFDEEAASYQHTINELNKALSENKGDLISRQAVLARVRLNYTNYQTVERHEIKDIIKSEPSAENKGEWIPVSERLPEKNVWVLVSVEQSGKCFQEIMRRNNYKEGWTDNIDFYTDEITAWQPLPEPYKAESEDKE